MAVDESQFKPEEYVEDGKIFWKRMAGHVLIIFALGVLAVVFYWPHDKPMNTSEFWWTIAKLPLAITAACGSVMALCRLLVVKGTAYENKLAAEVKDYVMVAASRPLAVLAASDHHGSMPSGGSHKEPREKGARFIRKAGGVYLFEHHPQEDHDDVPGDADILRHQALTSQVFSKILRDLSPSLHVMSAKVPCVVHLFIDNKLFEKQNIARWKACLAEHTSRAFPIVYTKGKAPGVMSLDTWLDDAIARESKEVRLFVGVQLLSYGTSPLPSESSTEAAVALMLAPDAVAVRYRLPREADLYRPVMGNPATHAKSIAQAFTFAGVEAKDIEKNWHVGVPGGQRGSLVIAENRQGVTVPEIDIDMTVGVAGFTAPWFAMASAYASLRRGEGTQMITAAGKDALYTMVLKPVAKQMAKVA